jgi:hypothetical protein
VSKWEDDDPIEVDVLEAHRGDVPQEFRVYFSPGLPLPEVKGPENLKDVVVADVSLKALEKGWAGHLKVADAVMSGRLSATDAIEMQDAARNRDASFRAGHAHGLLLRTNDLLRSYTDADYRARNSGT